MGISNYDDNFFVKLSFSSSEEEALVRPDLVPLLSSLIVPHSSHRYTKSLREIHRVGLFLSLMGLPYLGE